ncbi:unnamed protein product, partial [Brenthis ino]
MSYAKIHESFVRNQIWGFNPSESIRFAGHVPYGFQRFGESSKKLTNSALCDFSSNYRRRQSTEWAPVNVVNCDLCLTYYVMMCQVSCQLSC